MKQQHIVRTWQPPRVPKDEIESLPDFLPEPHWEVRELSEQDVTPNVASELLEGSAQRLNKTQRRLLYGLSIGLPLKHQQKRSLRRILGKLARKAT